MKKPTAEVVGWDRTVRPPRKPHVLAQDGRGRHWLIWELESDESPANGGVLLRGWDVYLRRGTAQEPLRYSIELEHDWQPSASLEFTREALAPLMGNKCAAAVVEVLPDLLRERYADTFETTKTDSG